MDRSAVFPEVSHGRVYSAVVGLDVHKDSIAVAHAQGKSADPPVCVGAVAPRQADLDKLIRRLQAKTPTLVFGYEAGPCGYTLHRTLTGQGSLSRIIPTAWT